MRSTTTLVRAPLPILFLMLMFTLSCMSPGREHSANAERADATVSQKPPFTDTLAAVFSQLAYCTHPELLLSQYVPGWKLAWTAPPVGGNYALAATDGERYVIAFRGSLLSFTEDAFNNWVYHDLNVVVQEKWPYSADKNAQISQGAFSAWQNVEKMKDPASHQTLTSFLLKNVKPAMPVYLTGHSLGGNLAVVYASWLWYKFNEAGQRRDNMQVITFAAPAAGNAAFAADFDSRFPRSLRIENKNDIVAKFPCTDKISKLGELFHDGPSASEITVGYKSLTTKLNLAFGYISNGLELLRFSGFTGYSQTCGEGKQITVAMSGKNKNNTAMDWFAEAGYQHSMERYAVAVGAPVIRCE